MDLLKIKREVELTVEEVGLFISREARLFKKSQIEEKSMNSLVTHVDRGAEEKLVVALQKILPEAGFITEEETVIQSRQAFNWIIDPIDGTTNFIHNLPFYCVSVALEQDDQLVLGVILEISRKEMFSAVLGHGAFLNGKRIHVSQTQHLKDAVIATGFPYYDYNALNPYLNTFEYLLKNTRGLRRFGSAALDLAYVACGRFDGFFEYSLNAWDVAGGMVIVREAGGVIMDFSGGEEPISRREIIAANPAIGMRMTNVIKGAFGYD